MKLQDVLFSVNTYDRDGDCLETGIFLHFGETQIKVADTISEFVQVAERISSMEKEIRENYNME